MGWSSANPIFNETISKVELLGISGTALTEIAETLIWQLQDGDWDTEDESVELFMDNPAIIQAFRNRGVRIPCKCTCCEHEPMEY